MTTITLKQITAAVKATLVADTPTTNLFKMIQDAGAGELTEGIQNPPTLQIYPFHGDPDDHSAEVSQSTFGAGTISVKKTARVDLVLDLYATQRNFIGQDFPLLMDCIDAVYNVLDAQTATPFFGLSGLQQIKWYWDYKLLINDQLKYPGATFNLSVWVY